MTTVIEIPTLRTKRLVLRAAKWGDYEAAATFRTGARAVGVGGPFEEKTVFPWLAELIGHWHLRGFGRWIIADPETDQALGVVGVIHPTDYPEPELAWSMFEGSEGKGYAFEAAQKARRFAYDTFGMTTLISMVHPKNTRSAALAKRLGAAPERPFEVKDYGTVNLWRHPGPGEIK